MNGRTLKNKEIVREVRVRKQVIVSKRVINSPQILMLPGIGPRKHLESLNILVVIN